MSHLFIDTEFITDEAGDATHLLSIGAVDLAGNEIYLENIDAPFELALPWVREHVLPKMSALPPVGATAAEIAATSWRTPYEIAQELADFARLPQTQIWGYHVGSDWDLLTGLYLGQLAFPSNWVPRPFDIAPFIPEAIGAQLSLPLPPAPHLLHNALEDARWCRQMYMALQARSRSK